MDSTAKRKIIKAGRRGGKTTGSAQLAVKEFLKGRRVLYGTPTQDQLDAFWWEVKRALEEPLDGGVYYKNESLHIIEVPRTKNRIRAKTCWNADTLRGDYGDLLILDEFQLMNEDTWDIVGAPMLLDNNGDAVFIYTPPSLRSISVTKARDTLHAAKMYKKAKKDRTGRWQAFHFTSYDNPFISKEALSDLTHDMTALAIRQEIRAEDIDEAPGALWQRTAIEDARIDSAPQLVRVVVAVDPPANSKAKKSGAGIMVGGIDKQGKGYLLADISLQQATPDEWGRAAVGAYKQHEADRIVAEVNNGGEMVEYVIRSIDQKVSYKDVHASRGKATRAEPVAARFEQGTIFHVGNFPILEDELCQWVPGDDSPHRLDAYVWLFTELMVLHSPVDSGGLGTVGESHTKGANAW